MEEFEFIFSSFQSNASFTLECSKISTAHYIMTKDSHCHHDSTSIIIEKRSMQATVHTTKWDLHIACLYIVKFYLQQMHKHMHVTREAG